MIFRETVIPGAFVVEPEPIPDERGCFARIFDEAEFAVRGLDTEFGQWSVSFNERAATLRGMHFQREPHAETKLVRCTRGALYDVIARDFVVLEREGRAPVAELATTVAAALVHLARAVKEA